jgi:hypothetical protein
MKLSEILKQDAEGMYRATEGLFKLVDDLDWKPATGKNWMTTGQLLLHTTGACGTTIRGFVTGDWGQPADSGTDDGGEVALPRAEDMPAAASVDEALEKLAEDRALCMRVLSEVDDDRLAERSVAPWGGPERTLFQHCNEMIWHLGQHKGQLFYYLKLQGKDVNTMHLWMGGE